VHEDRIFIDLTSLSKIYQDTEFSQNYVYSMETNVIFLEPRASSTLIEYIKLWRSCQKIAFEIAMELHRDWVLWRMWL